MSRARYIKDHCCLRYSQDQNFATENAVIAVLLGQNLHNYIQKFLPMFSECFCVKKPEIYRD